LVPPPEISIVSMANATELIKEKKMREIKFWIDLAC